MDSIRLLDLGLVPPVRSQTVYHALAATLTEQTPDTIVLVGPTAPYVCVGYHQETDKEVNLDYCRAQGLPVIRREVGGGAVYLDQHQVFIQWIFHRAALPAGVEARFALFARPLVATYAALGLDARFRPVNDIHVGGRKIGGTGAAQIGPAEVVVGSLMFDFDTDQMARVLRVSSEKMRDKVHQSLTDYMTTLKRELGRIPDRAAVVALYLEQAQAALGRPLAPGTLTPAELAFAAQLDEQFLSDEWTHRAGGWRRRGVKIHQDVRVAEAALKTPGGLLRATARLRANQIDDVTLSGDFTLLPAAGLPALEQALGNTAPDAPDIQARVEGVYRQLDIQSPGLTPADFAAVLARLAQA